MKSAETQPLINLDFHTNNEDWAWFLLRLAFLYEGFMM